VASILIVFCDLESKSNVRS